MAGPPDRTVRRAGDTAAAVSFVAGYRLDRAPVDSVEPLDTDRHLGELVHHKLVGVARAAMDAGDLLVDRPDALVEAHERALAEALVFEDAMLGAVAALTAAGIDARVLKGSALVKGLDTDPSERMVDTTELLVRDDALSAAASAMEDAGAHRVLCGASDAFEQRFAASITMRWHDTELDLQRTLAPGPYGLMIESRDLFERSASFDLAGHSLPTLPLETHLIHAAIHAALGHAEPRLGDVRDIAALLDHDLDLDLIMRSVERWRCTHPFALGLQQATAIGAADHALLDWAEAHRPGRSDRRTLATYRAGADGLPAQTFASLRVLGWRDRLAYVRALTTTRRG